MSDTSAQAVAGARVLVVVPTYNEADSLPVLLRRLRASAPDVDVLVVDDGSPDGTGALAERLAGSDAAVTVVHRADKQGLGSAYLTGFTWGLDRGYDVLVEMDADGSHRPETLVRLLAALGSADVVLGSRWIPGGRVVDWPVSRRLLSRTANLYVRLALGMPVADATGGYRAYRREVLETVTAGPIQSQGYCFQVDLLWRASQAGFRIVEVPITFTERAAGQSKMNGRIVAEALRLVTWWGLRRVGPRRWWPSHAARPGEPDQPHARPPVRAGRR